MGFDRWSWLRPGRTVLGLIAVGATTAIAQPTAPARPQVKGIWEPVSFTEDLDLEDVFFVTAEVGWASGKGGTIIHTKDGGATWTAQLGGDPASEEAAITKLRFIDEYRGWAVQGRKLLHTANGQDWEEVPGALPERLGDLAFVSPSQGVAVGSSTIYQATPTEMFLTKDGGKTWKKVAQCGIRVMIDGVNRNATCGIKRVHFPTPRIGYLVGFPECGGPGCGGPPVLGKTEDGGASWQFRLGPGDVKTSQPLDVFFTDERTGFVRVFGSIYAKMFATADGGETWKGVVGSPGHWLRFADPEVGWGFEREKLSFTTDGGARWNSRPHRFPAEPEAISFPRRDRAYVVGDHGMVFRYRVVPIAQATPPEVLVTAAMPGFASPLGEQVAQLDRLVDSLQVFVQQLPAQPAGTTGAAAAASSNPNAAAAAPTDSAAAAVASADQTADPSLLPPLDAPLPPASSFAADCCGKRFSRLELILGAIAGSLPQLITKNKNTNLLLAAVRMLADLPGQFRSVKGGLAAFRTATDQGAAVAALAQVTTAIETLKTQTSAALQKDLPPLDLGGAPPSEPPAAEPAPAVEQQVEAVADSAVEAVDSAAAKSKSKVAEAAKKGLGGLIKKKIKIPFGDD